MGSEAIYYIMSPPPSPYCSPVHQVYQVVLEQDEAEGWDLCPVLVRMKDKN